MSNIKGRIKTRGRGKGTRSYDHGEHKEEADIENITYQTPHSLMGSKK